MSKLYKRGGEEWYWQTETSSFKLERARQPNRLASGMVSIQNDSLGTGFTLKVGGQKKKVPKKKGIGFGPRTVDSYLLVSLSLFKLEADVSLVVNTNASGSYTKRWGHLLHSF